ncbi:polyphenol oxidase family protein [Thermus islandicus]|uniref:polyphenol oxidase family protein n=1 Tax=Thermus islandicus TaxID=540988 RepID=UPI0003B65CE8|nr:polyphenol oxidase family protein [Thermus islandicus]
MVPLLLTPLPVPHGFTTRVGGVSQGPFWSLNLSAATGDDPKRVAENQRRVLAAFGHPPVAGLRQVHGTEVHLVEGPGVWEGDGLLTRTPGLLLRVGVADCYPLLLYHPGGLVGALHAGWRGVVGGILLKALALLERIGLDPQEAHLALGPGIGGCCYQVGEEVALRFAEAGLFTFREDPGSPGRYLLDLEKALLLQAERAGLREERIYRVGLCSHCAPHLFSHRRDGGRTGRMWGLVLLPG